MKTLILKIRNNKKLLTALSIFAILITSFLVVLPFIASTYQSGHDVYYHYDTIRALNQAWQDGTFGSRIYSLIGQDYGYGTGFFYSMIPSSIAVIMMNILNISAKAALSIEFLILFFASGLVMYFFMKRISKNNGIAIIVACFYCFFPYMLTNLYVRFAFSEIFLTIAIPMIAWGLYELFEKENYKGFFPLIIIGYSISILCHFTLTIFISIFTLIYVLINFKKLIQKFYFVPLLIAAGTVILVTIFFWLPMLFNYGVASIGGMNRSGMYLWETALSIFHESYLVFSTILSIVIYIIYLCVYFSKPKAERTKSEWTLFILSTSALVFVSPLFPWFAMPTFITMLQFAWRLFIINAFTVSLMLGYIIKNLKNKTYLISIICGAFVILTVYHGMMIYYINANGNINPNQSVTAITNHSENEALGGNRNGDYYPKGATREYVFYRANDAMIFETNVNILEFAHYQTINQISFLTNNSESGYAVINIPYSLCSGSGVNITQIYMYDIYASSSDCIIEPFLTVDGEMTKIYFNDSNANIKITISYEEDSALQTYLQANPFEFIVKSGDVTATNFVKENTHTYTVDFSVTGESIVELPTFYYKGYEITYTTTSGTYNLEPVHGENGFIEVAVHESGTLSITFTGGTYLTAANITALIGLIGFALLIIAALACPKRWFTKMGDWITNYLKTHKTAAEILRFLIVGVIATLVDLLVMGIVMYAMETSIYSSFFNVFIGSTSPSTLATIVGTSAGFAVGLVVNYIMSILFVFNDKGKSKTALGFLTFTILSIIGLLINIAGMYVGYDLLKLNQWLVKIIMIIIVLIYNYISKKLLLFKTSKKDSPESQLSDSKDDKSDSRPKAAKKIKSSKSSTALLSDDKEDIPETDSKDEV